MEFNIYNFNFNFSNENKHYFLYKIFGYFKDDIILYLENQEEFELIKELKKEYLNDKIKQF